LAIESYKFQNPFISKEKKKKRKEILVDIGKHDILTWTTSHIGIHGNTYVDQEAKDALDRLVLNCL
jgi:hypothetical protein